MIHKFCILQNEHHGYKKMNDFVLILHSFVQIWLLLLFEPNVKNRSKIWVFLWLYLLYFSSFGTKLQKIIYFPVNLDKNCINWVFLRNIILKSFTDNWYQQSMQGWCVPDRCVPDRKFLDVAPLEQSVPWILCPWPMCPDPGSRSVGRYRGLGRPPAPNGSVGRLAGLAYAPDQVYWIGAPPSDARSAHT
jgi:hypothetical protein